MSNECQHNNHSHGLIWLFIWWSILFGGCEVDKLKSDVRQLEYKVNQCVTKQGP